MTATATTALHGMLRNLLTLVTGYALVRLISFIATLYVAKTLGPAGFGTLSFGLALAVLLGGIANLGLDDYIVREVARASDTAAPLFGDAAMLKLLVVPLGLLCAAALAVSNPQDTLLYLLVVAYGMLHSYLLLICAIFRGRGRMGVQTVLLAVQISLIAVASMAAARVTGRPSAVAAGYPLATLIAFALGYALLRREGIRPCYRWRPARMGRLVQTVLPFGITLIGLLLYDRLTIIFVVVLRGAAATGLFTAVYNIVLVSTSLPILIVAAVYPELSRRARQDRRAADWLVAPLVRYVAALGIAVTIALYALAPTLVPLLFGARYLPSIHILRMLAFSVLPLFLTIVLSSVLEAADRQRACAAGIGWALLVAAPLCFAATAVWGYEGGTIAYVLSHLILIAIMARLVAQTVTGKLVMGAMLRPAVAGGAAFHVVALGAAWPLALLLPCAGLVYSAALILTGTIGVTELALLRRHRSGQQVHDYARPYSHEHESTERVVEVWSD